VRSEEVKEGARCWLLNYQTWNMHGHQYYFM